jgi:hypothetical protein
LWPTAQHFLAFKEKFSAFLWIIHCTTKSACHFWAAELRSCFLAYLQRVPQLFSRFFAMACLQKKAGLHFEGLRFEALSFELSGKAHHSFKIIFDQFEVAKFIAGKNAHCLTE